MSGKKTSTGVKVAVSVGIVLFALLLLFLFQEVFVDRLGWFPAYRGA